MCCLEVAHLCFHVSQGIPPYLPPAPQVGVSQDYVRRMLLVSQLKLPSRSYRALGGIAAILSQIAGVVGKTPSLVDVSEFFFFLLGGGEEGVQGDREGGSFFFWKSQEGGGGRGLPGPSRNKRCFLNGVFFFRIGVLRGRRGSARAEGTKMLENSGVFRHFLFHWWGFPLLQAQVRNLKNTVWKAPFGTLWQHGGGGATRGPGGCLQGIGGGGAFEAIFCLKNYFYFLRLFLKTLPKYPLKQA